MPNEEDVLRIKKKLDRINDKLKSDGDADMGKTLDYLKRLDGIKMTLPILTKTRIGMTVNTLRKSTDDENILALTKSIIKAWKKFVPENNQNDGKKKHEGGSGGGSKESSSRASDTNDEVRLGCRKILTNALRGEGELLDGTVMSPEELAEIIETTIFKKFKETNARYKTQVRSRVFNLKDKKNPALRENVLCGVIKPEKIAVMTSEEMASDEVKNQRMAYVKEGIDAAQLAVAQGTKTDLLKCGKCLKNNCTYNQLQTRSADEPMTTFVMCNECGHRWKFC